jgi:hypothetical protein
MKEHLLHRQERYNESDISSLHLTAAMEEATVDVLEIADRPSRFSPDGACGGFV